MARIEKAKLMEMFNPDIATVVAQWNKDGVVYEDQLSMIRSSMRSNGDTVAEIISEHGGQNTESFEIMGFFIDGVGDYHCYYNSDMYGPYEAQDLLQERFGSPEI